VLYTGASSPLNQDIEFVKTVPANDRNNLVYFKHMDIGANFFAGYELSNGLSIMLQTQWGLVNINSETSSDLANKNTGFGLALGYRF